MFSTIVNKTKRRIHSNPPLVQTHPIGDSKRPKHGRTRLSDAVLPLPRAYHQRRRSEKEGRYRQANQQAFVQLCADRSTFHQRS
eukprot:15281_4